MVSVDTFMGLCLAQDGDRYVFGHEVSLSDPDPDTFDCSELVQWAAARAGVLPRMPDGSWNQVSHCRKHGGLISVEEGVNTRGALLFRFSSDPFQGVRPSSAHVAVSQGDGRTIEARGSKWGVGVWPTAGRVWTHAALIPGLEYTPEAAVVSRVPVDGTFAPSGRVPVLVAYADGRVEAENGATWVGDCWQATPNHERRPITLKAPIVKLVYYPPGYWLVAADGGVFSFGLPFPGSLGDLKLNAPIMDAGIADIGGSLYLVLTANDGGTFVMERPVG